MVHYRASDIVKESCMKIVYCTKNNIQKEVTEWMLRGVNYQHSVVEEHIKQGGKVYEEMAGTCAVADAYVDFSIDMIHDGTFIEIKSVSDPNDYAQWYLNQSILQCVLYKTLLLNMADKVLQTASFRIDESHPKEVINVDVTQPYRLIFGDVGVFEVDVTNPAKVFDFFTKKVKALDGYDSAKEFDLIYKHKEFDTLKGCFTYTKI